ncbi:Transcription termination factor family protein [Quillaja saponaria]|uniref:Transcription termination factor family protein n=1 Tax=Quillaja saponaria TaxID=32244 RepID=A0AAD7PYQ2_QUISA|nr:Transcription termination factor family protein [Quillaja saponaria]
MPEALNSIFSTNKSFLSSFSHLKPHFSSSNHEFPHPRQVLFPISSKTTISVPIKPTKTRDTASISPKGPMPNSDFQEKMLYLDSIGIDFISVISDYPPVISVSLADIKSKVEFMTSMDFTIIEFRRIVGMCPEILTSRVSDIVPIFTFLLREARVNGSDIKRVIHRRPRLLACSIKDRLRPTLYFLQSIGIEEVNKHTHLLSCSVENKLMTRIDYFENIGFSRRDATTMFRRFPQLFCYSIKDNLEPKFNYFVVEMGRDLKELKEFPQYFSFSLEHRIKPRHKCCVDMGVCFPLPILLKTNEARFHDRLEIGTDS